MEDNFEKNLIKTQLRLENLQDFIKTDYEYTTKSIERSHSMRKSGNDMYYFKNCDNQQMEEIFKFYTRSISFAPLDSEALALAYGNRSAVLHRMKKYKESILDINRALKLDKCDLIHKVKLLCRKVECLVAQGSPDCKKVYDEAACLLPKIVDESNNNNSVLKQIKKAKEALSKFSKMDTPIKDDMPEHMRILLEKEKENPFNSVSMHYNKKSGRHLITTRDIKPGEIIFVEKPYVICLNLSYLHIYCGHCFTKSWANIPCDCCNWCMFCSEECKNLAWMNYHNIECATVSCLITHVEIDYYDHVSLRSLLMGIKESGNIANFKAEIQSVDEWIDQNEKDIFKDELFQNTGFKSVYTLCNNKVSITTLKKYAVKITIILVILSKYTSLFGQNLKFESSKDLLENEDVLFIGSVFLKLRKRNSMSTQTIQGTKFDCKFTKDLPTCKINNCCSKGAYIAPMASFITHNCNPNTKKCMSDNQKLIVFSLQPIKKNSQLTVAYQQAFFEIERPLRQRLIKQIMNIVCDCEACKLNWPSLTELYKMPKDEPLLYAKTYNQKESDLYDENDPLVNPIINGHEKIRFDQTTLKHLSKAMEKSVHCLEQPSVVICELMICLGITFEKLYSLDLAC